MFGQAKRKNVLISLFTLTESFSKISTEQISIYEIHLKYHIMLIKTINLSQKRLGLDLDVF